MSEPKRHMVAHAPAGSSIKNVRSFTRTADYSPSSAYADPSASPSEPSPRDEESLSPPSSSSPSLSPGRGVCRLGGRRGRGRGVVGNDLGRPSERRPVCHLAVGGLARDANVHVGELVSVGVEHRLQRRGLRGDVRGRSQGDLQAALQHDRDAARARRVVDLRLRGDGLGQLALVLKHVEDDLVRGNRPLRGSTVDGALAMRRHPSSLALARAAEVTSSVAEVSSCTARSKRRRRRAPTRSCQSP